VRPRERVGVVQGIAREDLEVDDRPRSTRNEIHHAGHDGVDVVASNDDGTLDDERRVSCFVEEGPQGAGVVDLLDVTGDVDLNLSVVAYLSPPLPVGVPFGRAE
jgi:hypothetical protein